MRNILYSSSTNHALWACTESVRRNIVLSHFRVLKLPISHYNKLITKSVPFVLRTRTSTVCNGSLKEYPINNDKTSNEQHRLADSNWKKRLNRGRWTKCFRADYGCEFERRIAITRRTTMEKYICWKTCSCILTCMSLITLLKMTVDITTGQWTANLLVKGMRQP